VLSVVKKKSYATATAALEAGASAPTWRCPVSPCIRSFPLTFRAWRAAGCQPSECDSKHHPFPCLPWLKEYESQVAHKLGQLTPNRSPFDAKTQHGARYLEQFFSLGDSSVAICAICGKKSDRMSQRQRRSKPEHLPQPDAVQLVLVYAPFLSPFAHGERQGVNPPSTILSVACFRAIRLFRG
jgi:hypothetical protein